MDEYKKTRDKDEKEDETSVPDEKTKGDLEQSSDNFNVNEKDGSPVKLESTEEESDTSAVQDLFKSMGLGFWKTKKKPLSVLNKNIATNDAGDLQLDTAITDETSKEGNLSENTDEIHEGNSDLIMEENHEPAEELECGKDIEDTGVILEESPDISQEAIDGTEDKPRKKRFIRKLLLVPVIVLIAFLGYRLYGFIKEPRPPSEDVVATYSGKNLTKEELLTYVKSKGYREEEHGLCEKHGFDHSKCDKTEKCETHPIHSLEAYNQIIKMIAVQKIVDDWAKENGITQKNEVKHDFKHLVEEVSLDNLVDKVHKDQLSPDKIDKWEVQKYYDANKDKYKDKPFSEVEDEIRNILAADKDQQFFPEYIEKLKKNAALNVNYDILKVDPPTETEMHSFYEKNKEKFIEPKKVKILEIKVDISGSEDESRKKTDEALNKVMGGESFEDVAKKYSNSTQLDAYYVKQGEKGTNFEDKVFSLQVNEISSAFKEGNSFYVVKVIEKQEKRQKIFGEVLDAVKEEVLKEKEDKQYELRKNEALFSIHGKSFTLGEFKEEFKELSPEIQVKFSSFEAKKELIDQLIAKELLLEESGDDVADKEGSKEIEELKTQYLQQILHKEEIDEKLGQITDEEAKKFYEEKKKLLVEPAKAKIALIRVVQGGSEAEKNKARQRADEALSKIKNGADFSSVAKECSNDPSASAGGTMEQWIDDDEHLEPVLKENIFKLQLNQVSNVFEYYGGYYIVKLVQKEDKKQKTFEEVKEELKQALMDEKHHKKEAELEDELLKKSKLVVYKSSLEKMLKEQTNTDK